MTDAEHRENILKDCWENAFHSFGYSYLFDQRAQRYRKRIKLIQIGGVAIPALIGATATGYGLDAPILQWIIYVATPLLIIQFVCSIISINYEWDSELSYSFEASAEYDNLHDKFKKLAKFPPHERNELEKNFELLELEYNNRGKQDSRHSILDRERRMGMRYALREFQRECVACKIVPTDMNSTNCGVCGNF